MDLMTFYLVSLLPLIIRDSLRAAAVSYPSSLKGSLQSRHLAFSSLTWTSPISVLSLSLLISEGLDEMISKEHGIVQRPMDYSPLEAH